MFLQNHGVLGIAKEFRDGVLQSKVSVNAMRTNERKTYARHQLEHRGLGKLKQMHNLLKTLEHGLVIADSLGHTAGQAVAQSVVDVQLARRPRGQERVVQA